MATTAVYNFWLYELCDVYLEYLKPVFNHGSSDEVSHVIGTARSIFNKKLDDLNLFKNFVDNIKFENNYPSERKNYENIQVG